MLNSIHVTRYLAEHRSLLLFLERISSRMSHIWALRQTLNFISIGDGIGEDAPQHIYFKYYWHGPKFTILLPATPLDLTMKKSCINPVHGTSFRQPDFSSFRHRTSNAQIAKIQMVKMVSAARPVLGRMAARIVNVSGARSYSSIVRVTGTRSISAAGASPLVSGTSIPACSPTLSQPLVPRRYGHTVRIILKEDLPDGRGYSGDVMTVKAGYARNYLVPKKMALYATPENFERLGVTDPEAETIEEKRARLAAEAAAEEDEEAAADLRAADLLKHYLRNKVVSSFTCKAGADTSPSLLAM